MRTKRLHNTEVQKRIDYWASVLKTANETYASVRWYRPTTWKPAFLAAGAIDTARAVLAELTTVLKGGRQSHDDQS